ncbi:hypothetical protein K7472_31505 [Streptomyces sp. PTM05]|uniref:Uncharacterized protein n=1 Tax=Streptantibioticus parmotrematis TaxID=2873249 RepID=A0ABS7R333_9ACTN|nr:hypothetical protein [Streptantibioticus parmotrematis]MBY8889336.1 hypothetical protein [Streptantibioticus parmotrematis]
MPQNPGIDRRAIDKFVKDIAKEFERASRKHPIRMPVSAEASMQGGGWNSGATIESSPYLALLLMWLDAHAQQHPAAYVDVTQFLEEQGLPAEDASVLAFQLEQRGLVTIARILAGTPDVHLTDDGRVAVHHLKELQQDHAARHRYAAEAFLRWLYTAAHDQKPVSPVGFFAVPAAYYAGDGITGEELHQAVARLNHAGLVVGINTDPPTVAITPDGIECVLSGGTVSDYLNRPRVGDSYTINNSQGFVAGRENRVVQSNTFGLDTTALRDFASMVQQFAPTLNMEPDRQAELIHDAESLGEETAAENPELSRIRAAYHRVLSGLSAITTASAGLSAVIQKGQDAYRTVFGG